MFQKSFEMNSLFDYLESIYTQLPFLAHLEFNNQDWISAGQILCIRAHAKTAIHKNGCFVFRKHNIQALNVATWRQEDIIFRHS